MIDFAKGHGTGNDFVIVEDADGAHPLTAPQIATLCDRHTGIGGDGLLRVVRSAKHPEGVNQADEAEWFMDYYNADGSVAEMCGNGVRVYARYLLDHGLAEGRQIPLATRAGSRQVGYDGELFHVDMGPAEFGGEASVTIAVTDGQAQTIPGSRVSMGNPHLVCRVPDPGVYDLTKTPRVTGTQTGGVNVELISGDRHAITMRVHERGVGETQSCGTGACAAAAVALAGTGVCEVTVPGGVLTVSVTESTISMAGPAVVVAHGQTTLV